MPCLWTSRDGWHLVVHTYYADDKDAVIMMATPELLTIIFILLKCAILQQDWDTSQYLTQYITEESRYQDIHNNLSQNDGSYNTSAVGADDKGQQVEVGSIGLFRRPADPVSNSQSLACTCLSLHI